MLQESLGLKVLGEDVGRVVLSAYLGDAEFLVADLLLDPQILHIDVPRFAETYAVCNA